MFSDEPIFRLPPDAQLTLAITPLAEILDPFQEFLGVAELQKRTAGKIATQQAGGFTGPPRSLIYAVLDTGVDDQHRDLTDQILDAADFTNSISGHLDKSGHGSWCAGAIAARADDFGIRGIAYDAKLLCGKVLGDNGSGGERGISAGMKWAYERGADVFSLSLGGGRMSESLHAMFAEISQQVGKFIFCAAGNDSGPVNYPAAWKEVVAVGAIDGRGNLTQFTSRGPELDILAPGVEILSTVPGNRHATMSGTSMATPIAAAIGGLTYAAAVNAGRGSDFDSCEEMIAALRKTGRCNSGDACKYPVIDPRSLAKATDRITPIPPAPNPVPPVVNPAPVTGAPTKAIIYAGGRAFEFLGGREIKV